MKAENIGMKLRVEGSYFEMIVLTSALRRCVECYPESKDVEVIKDWIAVLENPKVEGID